MKIKMESLRNVGIVTIALGTAYGLGIISCVYWELKFLANYSKPEEKEK